MNDIQMGIEKRYNKMLLSRTPSERLRMTSRMYDSGRRLIISGLKKGGQQLNTRQLRGQVFVRMYGSDFTDADRERIIKKIPNIQVETDS